MPETLFTVRWPDGAAETCYSPSTVIKDYFEIDRGYTLAEFLDRCRDGLNAASARVDRVHGGGGCSRAMAQLAAIEAKAGRQTSDDARVRVEAFETR